MVYRGFPQRRYDVYEDLKPYYQFRHDLHVVSGVVCYNDRVIIAAALRDQVLDAIPAAHQGVSGIVIRVEDAIFWPGITPDIMRTSGSCMACVRDAPSQPAGVPVAPPGAGLFDAKTLLKNLREWCMTFNIQEEIATDCGPQMTSGMFLDGLKVWGICHRAVPISLTPTAVQSWWSRLARGCSGTTWGLAEVWTTIALCVPACSTETLQCRIAEGPQPRWCLADN
jgi:hypothetical protein